MSENLDFSPCNFSGFRKTNKSVDLIFENQPVYSEDGSIKHFSCHLSLEEYDFINSDVKLPLEAENLIVKYNAGERSCFLPLVFNESGPVQIYLEAGGKETLIATGINASLNAFIPN